MFIKFYLILLIHNSIQYHKNEVRSLSSRILMTFLKTELEPQNIPSYFTLPAHIELLMKCSLSLLCSHSIANESKLSQIQTIFVKILILGYNCFVQRYYTY